MWFDLVVLAILVYFAIRGAARGVVWQLAGIAGIVLCFAFADGISAAAGPYVHLQEPLNHWVVLFGAYLVFSFISFGIARLMHDWIEKAQMKEFNRHLGAAFGLIKGIALSLILAFLLVTVSGDAREALKESKSAYYGAHLMNRLHPIIPEKLHDALKEYIHLLDHEEFGLPDVHGDHDHSNGLVLPSDNATLGDPISGSPFFPPTSNTGSPTTNSPPLDSQSFFDQVRGRLTEQAKAVVAGAIQRQFDPQSQSQLQQDLLNIIRNTPTKDLGSLQRELINAGSDNLQQYVDAKLGPRPNTTPATNNGAPNEPPSVVPDPNSPWFTPPASTPPVATAGEKEQLLREISLAYSSIPTEQAGVQKQIADALVGLPEAMVLGVLRDMRADVRPGAVDPDPQTNGSTQFNVRVVRQLQLTATPFASLSVQWQQLVRSTLAQSPSSSNL